MFFHSLLPELRGGPVPALNHFPMFFLTFIDPGKVCWVCTLHLIITRLYCKVTYCLFPPGCCPVRSQFHFCSGTFISLFKDTQWLLHKSTSQNSWPLVCLFFFCINIDTGTISDWSSRLKSSVCFVWHILGFKLWATSLICCQTR